MAHRSNRRVGICAVVGLVRSRIVCSHAQRGGPADHRRSEASELQNTVRTTLLQGLAGLAVLLGAFFTYRQLRIAREGQVTERFTRAIDQLGTDNLDVRLGCIYALERIAKDSSADGATIAEVLAAFIRGRAPWPPTQPDQPSEDAPIQEIRFLRYRAPDVQAALTVLGRQPSMTGSQPLNLSDTDLRWADLSNADLQGARLLGARLQKANLRAAKLQRVNMDHAQLQGARSNAKTVWPDGFDWKAEGVELQEK
jgi:Pentapeptide repeats (8 copies)